MLGTRISVVDQRRKALNTRSNAAPLQQVFRNRSARVPASTADASNGSNVLSAIDVAESDVRRSDGLHKQILKDGSAPSPAPFPD